MQIRQVSAALDQKLAQLDQQLKQLEQQRAQQHSDQHLQLDQDILALQQIRTKLIKSKNIAWRAHELQDQGDERRRARQRIFGLSLCIFSLIGAVVLVYLALQQ